MRLINLVTGEVRHIQFDLQRANMKLNELRSLNRSGVICRDLKKIIHCVIHPLSITICYGILSQYQAQVIVIVITA